MSSQYRWSINLWQKHEAASCYNNYYRYKTEIEEKIDNFYRFKNRNVYTQWQDLNEYIKQKNNEIKNCDRKKRISLDLLEDDKIKGFSTLCPDRSSCRTKPSPPVKKDASLQPAAKRICKGDSCQQRKILTKSPKAKPELVLPTESSNAISSPILGTKNPVEVHPEREESKQPVLASQAPQDTNHRGSPVQNKGRSSESLDIHIPKKHELEQASAQPASLPAPVTTTELSTHQFSDSPRSNASEESDASSPPEEIDLKGSNHQSGISAGQTSDDNLHSLQSITGITDGIQELNNQTVRVEIKDGLSTPGNVLHSTEVGEVNPPLTSTGDVSSSSTEAACANTDKKNIPRPSTCDRTSIDTPTNREPYSDEDASVGFVGGEGDINADVPSAENGNERDTNNGNILDTLSEFFNAIQNKPQIIKTSAPIGIALLLGLLFKFTPLWRVVTKKNRKKGAGIIEELNSVVQEPSIMDDERSIPFSYGAFEYSSFDQNVY
ncbi:VIR protein [Plasmodium vivax]|uniref:VIR protein n=1 Tax=Plasmodium vivax TaxID=5855 RepID=A0A1G4E8G2_PLAVI|nr:VIR protein [Plasmodium vivax]